MKKNIEDTRETFAEEIKDLKTSWREIKNAVTKMQNRLDKISMRTEVAEENIGDREDKIMKKNEAERKGEENY